MKKIGKKAHEKIITFLLFVVLYVGVVSVIALVCGVIIRFLGFEYKSIGSIILFFLISTIITYPVSMIAEMLPKVLLSFDKISRKSAILLYVILDTIATALGLIIIDYFMESVSATVLSIIIIALLLSLIGVKDIDKKPDKVE